MSDIYMEQPDNFNMIGSDPSKDEQEYNPAERDDFDEQEHGEQDPGDFEYCNDCKEWTLQSHHIEVNPDTHTVLTVKLCPCGAESEEI